MHNKSAGFSLPEVILIVAVLAIISAMAFPDMASFFARQRLEQERTQLEQIKKAMEVYSRKCGQLPAEGATNPRDCSVQGSTADYTWYQALASVSNLSANEIYRDTWNVPRRYTHAQEGTSFLGGTGNITFDYGSVRSNGPNRCNDTNGNTTTCPHHDGGFPSGTPDWTLSGSTTYGSFTPVGDDMVIKFTDNQIKAAAYEETLRRLERVITALDRYAQAKFNEAIVLGTDECVSARIYYPMSGHNGWNGTHVGTEPTKADGTPCVPAGGWTYPVAHALSTVFETDTGDEADRRNNMQELMRELGLPLDHCCSALDNRPFFYYSSPGVRVGGGGCRYSIAPPYFPPKVVVDPGPNPPPALEAPCP